MSLVLGIDSSTQSCKAVLVDASSGTVVTQARASHPDGTQVDPQAWVDALDEVCSGLIERADAVAVAGQQHGMVALDRDGAVVRPAMLWNDTSSAPQAQDIVAQLGGPQACAQEIGSVMVASFTGSKLAWLRDNEPDHAQATASVALPHDYLTWQLTGRDELTTDHGDAYGTGYYSTTQRAFLPELAAQFVGHDIALPRIAEPAEVVGTTSGGVAVAAGTGDNAAAALGLGLRPGEVCVSIGTSGVASAAVAQPVHDGSGLVAGFCDATGGYLPLACTLNGARVLDFAARLLGVDHAGLSELALQSVPGAHGVTLLPYFDGERTPNRPDAQGVLNGLTTATSREDVARAAVEGVVHSLRDAVAALEAATGVETTRILLIGGAARAGALQQVAAEIFGVPVTVPAPAEYVALGAARQAAWALSGKDEPPVWARAQELVHEPDASAAEQVAAGRQRYDFLRDATGQWGRVPRG